MNKNFFACSLPSPSMNGSRVQFEPISVSWDAGDMGYFSGTTERDATITVTFFDPIQNMQTAMSRSNGAAFDVYTGFGGKRISALGCRVVETTGGGGEATTLLLTCSRFKFRELSSGELPPISY